MPELPDLVHVAAELSRALPGRTITEARTGDPTVLRIMVSGQFPQVLLGRNFQTVERRGHFICLGLSGDLVLAVNCMLAGRFVLAPRDGKNPRALALALGLSAVPTETGAADELRYVDDRRMGKVYVAPAERLAEVPQLGTLGVDLLSPAFTAEAFRALAQKRRDQVRQFLMDKSALASIGNAYADEILFAARIHPKTFVRKLNAADLERLYAAIVETTGAAIEEICTRNAPIEVKVRDFLKVRGRTGQPCPVCGTRIRAVRVGDGDACFCPTCQPASRALFVDWSKLPPRSK